MRVLVVDDHPVILEVMEAVLRRTLSPRAVYTEKDLGSAVVRARRLKRLDLVVLDLMLPGCHGIEALTQFLTEFPKVPVVVISAIENGNVVCAAIAAGAKGYIPKTSSIPVIASALSIVATGGTYVPPEALTVGRNHAHQPENCMSSLGLSARQLEVLERIAQGLHNKQIADELNISENTVKHHAHDAFKALGVSTRTEALLVLVRRQFPLDGIRST